MTGKINLKSYPGKLMIGLIISGLFLVNFACNSVPKTKEKTVVTKTKPVKNTAVGNEVLNIDQAAVDLFKSSTEYLNSLERISVETQNTIQKISKSGHKVDIEMFSSLIVSRPNKFRAERLGKLNNRILYYNGNEVALYNTTQKVYSTAKAPETIEQMFDFIQDNYQLGMPAYDLMKSNSYSLMTKDLLHAEIIGKEMIGYVQCVHLLFKRPGVDFQIWIADEWLYIPFKYEITDTSTPESFTHTVFLRNWNIKPKIQDYIFNFNPPEGTSEVNFQEIE